MTQKNYTILLLFDILRYWSNSILYLFSWQTYHYTPLGVLEKHCSEELQNRGKIYFRIMFFLNWTKYSINKISKVLNQLSLTFFNSKNFENLYGVYPMRPFKGGTYIQIFCIWPLSIFKHIVMQNLGTEHLKIWQNC